MQHVMIDLETLGTTPDAPIIAIGAVNFDIRTGKTGPDIKVNRTDSDNRGVVLKAIRSNGG